jgi:hypothetical protein
MAGCCSVVQHPDGSFQAVSAERAEEHLDAMEPEQRTMYEKI